VPLTRAIRASAVRWPNSRQTVARQWPLIAVVNRGDNLGLILGEIVLLDA